MMEISLTWSQIDLHNVNFLNIGEFHSTLENEKLCLMLYVIPIAFTV